VPEIPTLGDLCSARKPRTLVSPKPPDLLVVDVSDAFVRAMSAGGREHVVNQTFSALSCAPDVLAAGQESLSCVLREAKLHSASVTAGGRRWRVASWPVFTTHGHPPRLQYAQQEWDETVSNTDAEAALVALQLASSTAQAADRAKTAFLSNVSAL
jgi:hypothetical protein